MKKSLVLSLVLALGFMAGKVLSKDEPRLPPEDVIKALEKYGTPGPEHEWLKRFEGTYDVRIKATLDPTQPMRESTAHAEDRIIMNGLFLQETFRGKCPLTGKDVVGNAYLGFDNASRKFQSLYMDSLKSGIVLSEGTKDASGKVITLHGKCPDPITGELKNVRTVMTIVDDKTTKFEEFVPDKEGKEFRSMEITYVRK